MYLTIDRRLKRVLLPLLFNFGGSERKPMSRRSSACLAPASLVLQPTPRTTPGSRMSGKPPPKINWERAEFTAVLSPSELYNFEGVQPEIHPLLALKDEKLMLRYDMETGDTKVFVANSHEEADFGKYAARPATLPRLSEILLITRSSPWVTTVRNPSGVTLADIFVQLWKDYSNVDVTKDEFDQLGLRQQDQLQRRIARSNSPRGMGMPGTTAGYGPLPLAPDPYAPYGHGAYGYSPYAAPLDPFGYGSPGRGRSPGRGPGVLARRTDWLLGKCIFNGLRRDDEYCRARIGYVAPNVFVLELVR
ncbi:hypothetical protein EXIGLDRAFT_515301 [Exidia glandulosa HHB12029]|uniref:DUF6699 domain-containing protein n=1 Tax=Exidia glandulosa HHB12029 TaxID=1314781 RepID=A0A165J8Z2_EXIGL|nr:hypothetical protein EXIGLDRAFT_515301 [Exidia glandulosa HHB12029]